MNSKRDLNALFTKRSLLLAGGGAAALGAVALRMAYLQTLDPTNYREEADNNRFDVKVIAPPRGVIYDRFGTPLAITSRDYRIEITPNDTEDLEGAIRTIAAILNLDEAWTQRRIRDCRNARRFDTVPLRQGLTWEEFSAINVRLPELRGVTAEAGEVRRYPQDVVFAHPIGYVQKPTQRDIERVLAEGPEGERRAVYLRDPNVRVGKSGLEAQMEAELHGTAGWRKVEVNAAGRVVSEFGHDSKPAVQGAGVVLTLDAQLQTKAMEAMAGQSGSAIVMDTVNGDILVMASAPGFDANHFVNGIGQEEFSQLNNDEYKPLYHKAVTGTYSPGSTFKMIVGIAAKQAGMPDDWHVNCPGYFPFGGRNFHCWRRGGHGTVDLHNALKVSCDVFFYRAALFAGPERIAAVARAFGFGREYDVNVPNVRKGIVPDPEWWRSIGRGQWTPGLTVNFGIGQGDLQVTPLQLAVMAARIGSNGHAVIPRLVREAPGVREPRAFPMVPGIDPAHLAAVRAGMYGVSNEGGGTAISASTLNLVRRPDDGKIVELTDETRGFEPVRIAGKTGTAQVRIITAAERATGVRSNASLRWGLRDHALFVCFGPWDDTRYACAVVIEHGGGGSAVAGPIAKQIMREAFLRDPARREPARLATLEAHIRRPA
ncbi:MAG: penicillin-binding protein 2 [Hyphomonadaceae bacterium]